MQALSLKHDALDLRCGSMRQKLRDAREQVADRDRQLEVTQKMLQRLGLEKAEAQVGGTREASSGGSRGRRHEEAADAGVVWAGCATQPLLLQWMRRQRLWCDAAGAGVRSF
jgi:hypothetical protein